ncbi:MAG: magnesium transporter [Runella slithyformis]|nr:MAG: magnesium transporter [Runella slithyformis]TAF27450.1 MAG: magnesium transporter [Runella slithyformis]TAF46014.1 MAG: magnesium transporter [Runella slithyformis]TAF81299.1 MAG: magnesium transporter [Runella slithyformis]TAH14874.1 MAG: magnesium transporter [Runella slithyformis]
MTFELTKEYVERIEMAIEARDEATLKAEMEELFPADINTVIDELEPDAAHYLFRLLDTEVGAEILANIDDPADRRQFLSNFSSAQITHYIELFDSDDAADLLKEQSVKVREEVIALLKDREQARFILDLLPYDEDVAGGLMQKELVKANVNWTVNECIEEIRKQAEDVEKVYAVYVIDDNQTLLGLVSLKNLVLARKNTKIGTIFDDDILYVETYRPVEEVVEIMQRHDLDAIPVVNVQKRLLGRITIDDVIDVITEKAEEDIQAIAGITGEVEEDDTVWAQAKARLPWLLVGVAGSLMAATVIRSFEGELGKVAALAMFIPIMGSTGGNVGIQTASLIVQTLSDKSGLEISWKERLRKVVLIAILNGLIIGLLAGLYVWVSNETELFWVVSLSLLAVVLLASFMGTITPLLLNRIGINPAIASGPFITTANDLVGIGTYFLIAHYLLKM